MAIDNASYGDSPYGFFYLLQLRGCEPLFPLALISTADLEVLREVEVSVASRDRPFIYQAENSPRVQAGAFPLPATVEALLEVINIEIAERGEI